MDKYLGKRLDGRYEIREIIGVGGMAVVYKGYDVLEKKVVAVKVLKDEFLFNDEFLRRFRNEARAIAVLSHPNIVKVFDVSQSPHMQYIVMEYIDGITFREYLNQQKIIKWKEAVHFTLQILRALQHAHDRGIVHRDIKPHNIMLLRDGTIKVTDFGIARFSRSETKTMTDKAIGSVHYISPEQARGDTTDEKADIYSVGVMLYEMLTGTLPFDGDSPVSIAIMQMQADPRRLRELNETVPEGLEDITLRAMQKDPAKRYQSAAEMLMDIDEFRRNPSIHFEYKYFIDEQPTKYVDAINKVRGESEIEEEVEEEEESNSKVIPILAGIAIACVAALVLFLIGAAIINPEFIGCPSRVESVELPNFEGMNFEDVKADVRYRDFQFDTINERYDEQPAGTILEQNPKPPKTVKKNAKISLVISKGPKMVKVTDVYQNEQGVAEETLRRINLVPKIVRIPDKDVPKGFVVKTIPERNTEVQENSEILVYVSNGPVITNVEVPQLIGVSVENAKILIESSTLKVGQITYVDDARPEGTVIAQNPESKKSIPSGSTVDITVSNGKKPAVNYSLDIDLPTSKSMIQVSIFRDGKSVSGYPATFLTSEVSRITLNLTGTGKTYIKVFIDNIEEPYREYEIDFDEKRHTLWSSWPYDYLSSSSDETTTSSSTTSSDHSTSTSSNTTTTSSTGFN